MDNNQDLQRFKLNGFDAGNMQPKFEQDDFNKNVFQNNDFLSADEPDDGVKIPNVNGFEERATTRQEQQQQIYQQFGFKANNYQQTYQQQSYQQQPYQNSTYEQQSMFQVQQPYQNNNELDTPVSTGEWLLSFLVTCIPCIGIIMMFVWAFGSGYNKSKSNYFKAALIWGAIWILVFVVFIAIILVTTSKMI